MIKSPYTGDTRVIDIVRDFDKKLTTDLGIVEDSANEAQAFLNSSTIEDLTIYLESLKLRIVVVKLALIMKL